MRQIPIIMTRLILLMLLILTGITLSGCSQPAAATDAPPLVVDSGVDANAWELIPAGDFLLGLNENRTPLDHAYEMMVTHVTNEQYAAYLNEALAAGDIQLDGDTVSGYYGGDEFHAHEHEEEIAAGDWPHLSLDHDYLRLTHDGSIFSAKEGYKNHPMTLATWFGAQAYCEFYGWRLPSEVEWEKAARGSEGQPYPWGEDIAPNNANYYQSHDPFEEEAGNLGDTTPVGFYNGRTYEGYETLDSASPYGLYDMSGNAWQWLGDVKDGTHLRLMAGGSKADYAHDLRTWTRNSARPTFSSTNVGFRCARDS